MPISGRLLEMISARSATRASDATRTISDTATNITSFSSRSAKRSGRLRSFQVRTTLPGGSAAGSRRRHVERGVEPAAASTSSRRSAVPSSVSATARGSATALLLLLGARRPRRCRRGGTLRTRGCGPNGREGGARRDDLQALPRLEPPAGGERRRHVEPLGLARGAGERPRHPAVEAHQLDRLHLPALDQPAAAAHLDLRRGDPGDPQRGLAGGRGVGARRAARPRSAACGRAAPSAARSGTPRSPPATGSAPPRPAPGRRPRRAERKLAKASRRVLRR